MRQDGAEVLEHMMITLLDHVLLLLAAAEDCFHPTRKRLVSLQGAG
jgi:hypothetical protein